MTTVKFAVLNINDKREITAKRSLTRWMHGLSAVEPGHVNMHHGGMESGVLSAESVELEVYSPTRNFLVDRRVPVPLNSSYLQDQLNYDLERSCTDIVTTATQGSSVQVDLLSSVTVEKMLSMPVFPVMTSFDDLRRIFKSALPVARWR